MSGRTVVVDFDGTVTEEDLLDTIAGRFGDPVVYEEVEDGLHGGTMPLREVITREFRPVTKPLETPSGSPRSSTSHAAATSSTAAAAGEVTTEKAF